MSSKDNSVNITCNISRFGLQGCARFYNFLVKGYRVAWQASSNNNKWDYEISTATATGIPVPFLSKICGWHPAVKWWLKKFPCETAESLDKLRGDLAQTGTLIGFPTLVQNFRWLLQVHYFVILFILSLFLVKSSMLSLVTRVHTYEITQPQFWSFLLFLSLFPRMQTRFQYLTRPIGNLALTFPVAHPSLELVGWLVGSLMSLNLICPKE